MKSSMALKDKDGNWKSFNVPHAVYVYIRQLEECIKNPRKSKLKEVYKERFTNDENKGSSL